MANPPTHNLFKLKVLWSYTSNSHNSQILFFSIQVQPKLRALIIIVTKWLSHNFAPDLAVEQSLLVQNLQWNDGQRIIFDKHLFHQIELNTYLCFMLNNEDDITWYLKNHQQFHYFYFFNSLPKLTTLITSNIHITGHLWGESTGDQGIPLTKGQYFRKHFHGITSTCRWVSARKT